MFSGQVFLLVLLLLPSMAGADLDVAADLRDAGAGLRPRDFPEISASMGRIIWRQNYSEKGKKTNDSILPTK